MPKLHIANTFFEWELETQPKMSLREAFLQDPIFLQLQFLSMLYADAHDTVLLSDLPSSDYWSSLSAQHITFPSYLTLEEKKFPSALEIESWGPSQLIASWAEARQLSYCIPELSIVREVNSKYFSFEHGLKLPNAALLTEESQAKRWLLSFPGTKVLKTCFGVSGKGHLIIENESASWPRIAAFLHKEWNKGLPVIAEPWVKRILDFSTQWHIGKEEQILYLGATICHNDSRGRYQYNEVGEEKALFNQYFPQLMQHRQEVLPLLTKIANKGFFGHLGLDAMLYHSVEDFEAIYLQPIVEINARKTMGWAALAFRALHFPNHKIRFSYINQPQGHLPNSLVLKHRKEISFARNLMIEVCN